MAALFLVTVGMLLLFWQQSTTATLVLVPVDLLRLSSDCQYLSRRLLSNGSCHVAKNPKVERKKAIPI